MNIQWVGPAPDPNYLIGRQGNPITMIVQHWMDGTIESALALFMTPRPDAPTSAHYLVGQERGKILQLVKDEDTAYHAGDWTTNLLSIGIEAEASPTIPPSDDLYANLAELYQYLRDAHHLDLVENVTVKPHRAIVATQCPGTIDIAHIIELAGGTMTAQETYDLIAPLLQEKIVAPQADTNTAIKDALAALQANAAGSMSDAELAVLLTKLGVILENAGANVAPKP
jgi:hypothetical protein